MNTDMLLHALAREAPLARLDGTDYIAVSIVYALSGSGEPALYCTRADWPTTEAARLAERDGEIAALRLRVAELEARLATPVVPPTVAAAATGMPLSSTLDCPDCERSFRNEHALNVHRGRAHSARPPDAAPQEAPWQSAVVLIDDRDDWRCGECKSNAHARSLTHPSLCLRCAGNRKAANGTEVH